VENKLVALALTGSYQLQMEKDGQGSAALTLFELFLVHSVVY
jgi:hypothetical protein